MFGLVVEFVVLLSESVGCLCVEFVVGVVGLL